MLGHALRALIRPYGLPLAIEGEEVKGRCLGLGGCGTESLASGKTAGRKGAYKERPPEREGRAGHETSVADSSLCRHETGGRKKWSEIHAVTRLNANKCQEISRNLSPARFFKWV